MTNPNGAKIFIDCGYYSGKALDYYVPLMDETWTVYAFEPNTELNVEESVKRFPFTVHWIPKAVWTEDGEASFNTDEHNNAYHIGDGSETVPTIDFSKFVDRMPKDAIIVCSMDIEGSEYPVLRKMLEDGTAGRLSLVDIEFHDRLIDGETPESSAMLRQQLEGIGVLVKLKL